MSYPKCPTCCSAHVQKRGKRRGKVKYFCTSCSGWFQINRARKKPYKKLLLSHLDGHSFRSLASEYNVSPTTAYRYALQGLRELPECIDVTRMLCSRFCGQLLVDGKYLSVGGYEKKIPVIYGIDYLSHDIPHYLLAKAESYQACYKFFESLRLANYPLQALVCDDNRNIYEACKCVYPKAVTQLCTNHYKENIRKTLESRKHEQYQVFVQAIEYLFSKKRSKQERDAIAGKIVEKFREEHVCLHFLADLQKREHLLFAYQYLKGIPTTTNLIESFNSHLQGRRETIKGFDSFKHADLWLNGYFLRRRTKKFTDCSGKFKNLNGKTSLSKTLKSGVDIPVFF